MNLPTVLDVAIGLVLILFVLSSIASSVSEAVSGLLQDRPEMLRRSIYTILTGNRPGKAKYWVRLLSRWKWGRWLMKKLGKKPPIWPVNTWEPTVVQQFWRHPRIAPLTRPDRVAPSYLPGDIFSAAALDLALGDAAPRASDVSAIIPVLERNRARPKVGVLATNILKLAQGHLAAGTKEPFARTVQNWYDQSQARTTGEFKRLVVLRLFWIGLALAALLNADIIRITFVLAMDDKTSAAIANVATALTTPAQDKPAQNPDPATPIAHTTTGDLSNADLKKSLQTSLNLVSELKTIGFPIGWNNPRNETQIPGIFGNAPPLGGRWWFQKILGFVIAAFAVTFGAPFWFELLTKLVGLRATGPRPQTQKEENPEGDETAAHTPELILSDRFPIAGRADAKTFEPLDAEEVAHPQRDLGNVSGDEIDVRHAYWSSVAAAAAYNDDVRYDRLTGELGFAECTPIDVPAKIAEIAAQSKNGSMRVKKMLLPDTQLVVCKNARVTLIAFRGTEKNKPADIITDASCALVDWKHAAHLQRTLCVHDGFAAALDAVWDQLRPHLRGDILLTGHSLGGALATLVAARICAGQPGENWGFVKALFTFGSPRVGDLNFSQWLGETLGPRCVRFVNDMDVVPRVPPRAAGYSHVGETMFFDIYGTLHQGATIWDECLSTMTQLVVDYKNTGSQTITDHRMIEYYTNCQRLIKNKRKALPA